MKERVQDATVGATSFAYLHTWVHRSGGTVKMWQFVLSGLQATSHPELKSLSCQFISKLYGAIQNVPELSAHFFTARGMGPLVDCLDHAFSQEPASKALELVISRDYVIKSG